MNLLATLSFVAALLLHGSFAAATPTTSVESSVLATGTATDMRLARSRGVTDVVVRRITIPPGVSTGWHYHDGELIAVVESGTLTRVLADCSIETTAAGSSFVEPAGSGHVHVGRNQGTEPVVLYVTYLLPSGSAPATEAADPGCEG
jgi:quercetin dioxygenase-like cupin family protein